jgi:hypothetical protein
MIVFEIAVLISNFLVLFVTLLSNISKKAKSLKMTSQPVKVTSMSMENQANVEIMSKSTSV